MSFLPAWTLPHAQQASQGDDVVTAPSRADLVLVKKAQRRLYLMRDGWPFRTYRIALGFEPLGHKQREGDGRTPEGDYLIDWRNPNSRFTKSLYISYPNQADRLRAASQGWSPGGHIMIHGEPRRALDPALQALVRDEDWTEGCIAVSNLAIEELWRYIANGTPIEIRP